MPRPFILIIGLMAICHVGKSQDAVSDSGFTKAAYDNAVSYYHKYTDKQARLYNGVLHIGYSHKIEGHAYYPENTWNQGTVVYDGLTFNDVKMMYDVYTDELIIQHFHRLMVTLHNAKVKEFSWGNHKFIRFERDSTKNIPLSTGFYEELYKGKSTLLAKRHKIMEEVITDHLEVKFILKNYYYINRSGTWYAVKSYKDLTDVLKEKSKEIRQHLKKNKVRFRKEKEKAITLAIQHFDAITQ